MNSKRYIRQTVLPEIGSDGQFQINNSKVLCVGVGGLGSPASLYLASAGVGLIGLIDPDRIDISNLQRQILFQNNEQGQEKVSTAKNRLLALNPEIQIETFNEALTAKNAESIFSQYDLVIDGSDNFETKFLINDTCYRFGIPMIYGAVDRFEGQVALFHGRSGACYRCLHPSPPQSLVRNCAQAGVLGSIVGTIGTLQATLALQYLISRKTADHVLFPTIGQLTIFDLMGTWTIRSIHVPKNPKCPTCSRLPHEVELQFSLQNCSDILSIDVQNLMQLLESHQSNILLLDVREKDEWNKGHIDGATHWPLSQLEKGHFPNPSTQWNHIITYCQSGKRSKKAAQLLLEAGLTSPKSLSGGIHLWPKKLIS